MNILETYKGFLIAVNKTVVLMLKHFISINEYVVKTDEENIEDLLKTDEDKATFQKAIDELVRGDMKSRQVSINNKEITISI
ncbi:hypothetical protein [Elizabethkingia ursingii]|uniref:hypothetical protein n=1 Tax=Elizabethkingia ursingii TaxID=1756150 RepID=UPI00075155E9|nr:hypothetical protein [Elizabethkingia ursingii]KUY29789.1 hypothetical protein ATB96_17880 [Elizabethkingia ursingii]